MNIPNIGKYEYKTVDTSTISGLKEAEKLQEDGWTIGSVGLFRVQFYKENESKDRKSFEKLFPGA
jgi:hypothetical protein